MLDLDEKYVLSDDIVLRSIHDKFLCLDTKNGMQYRLNRVSYDLLTNLTPEVALSEIIDKVAQNYNIALSVFSSDAVSLLNLALNKEIIRKEV